jgi:hypothetical protein
LWVQVVLWRLRHILEFIHERQIQRFAIENNRKEKSCGIVGLFHDIGKIGMSGKPYHLPEIKDGKPTGNYTINPEIVAMGLSL